LCPAGCRTAQDAASADHFFGSFAVRIAATHSSQSLSISSCAALSSACCSRSNTGLGGCRAIAALISVMPAALAYLYFENEAQRRLSTKRLTRDEAFLIAVHIAKLPRVPRQILKPSGSRYYPLCLSAFQPANPVETRSEPDAQSSLACRRRYCGAGGKPRPGRRQSRVD
jgi:hypothetical protein